MTTELKAHGDTGELDPKVNNRDRVENSNDLIHHISTYVVTLTSIPAYQDRYFHANQRKFVERLLQIHDSDKFLQYLLATPDSLWEELNDKFATTNIKEELISLVNNINDFIKQLPPQPIGELDIIKHAEDLRNRVIALENFYKPLANNLAN